MQAKRALKVLSFRVLWITLWVPPGSVCLSWGHFGILTLFLCPLYLLPSLIEFWPPLNFGQLEHLPSEAQEPQYLKRSRQFSVAVPPIHWCSHREPHLLGPQWTELALSSAFWRLPTPAHCLKGLFLHAMLSVCLLLGVRCVSMGERLWNGRLSQSPNSHHPSIKNTWFCGVSQQSVNQSPSLGATQRVPSLSLYFHWTFCCG